MAPNENTIITNGPEESEKSSTNDRDLKIGEWLASPPSGEEIVVTGVAGYFPSSDNVYEFRDNLMNKVDMVTENKRWNFSHPEIPERSGFVRPVCKFDSGYFGFHNQAADISDPMGRMVLERVVEAIMDAGVNPKELEGTNTFVYVSIMNLTDQKSYVERSDSQTYVVTGSLRSLIANKISYHLKLRGKSTNVDAACSSSLYAIQNAYEDMRRGLCDAAIVASTNLIMNPFSTLQFSRLGVLSMDGRSKSFDETADGYVRAESICAVFLQKSKNARRVYSKVVHAKTNCDGFKEHGITFPSSHMQKQLLLDFYRECKVDRSSLTFLEAHGTGTKVGDPEEANAMDEVFMPNRNGPLLVGSVKSNIGHSEPAAGICSITKVVCGIESGYIPPNINFNTPRSDVEGLQKGRLVVVDEKRPWPKEKDILVGINSFGFGGANCHTLLASHDKLKTRHLPLPDVPRIMCFSGRTPEAVEAILTDVRGRPFDVEFMALINELFKIDFPSHRHRAHVIFGKSGEILSSSAYMQEDYTLRLHFGSFLENWMKIFKELSFLPVFSNCIQRINNTLSSHNLKPIQAINTQGKCRKLVPHEILGSVYVQMALADVLNSLQLKWSLVSGSGVARISAAYAQAVFGLDEAALCVYHFASVLESGVPDRETAFHQKLQSIHPRWSNLDQRTFVRDVFKSEAVNNSEDTSYDQAILAFGEPPNVPHDDNVIVQFGENCEGGVFLQLLQTLGSVYNLGFTAQVNNLYPKIDFPVSRGTPMISPLIKWWHEKDWFSPIYDPKETVKQGERDLEISSAKEIWAFLTGHVIDGRNLFPATGYLFLVIDTFAGSQGCHAQDLNVILEDVKFLRAVTVNANKLLPLQLHVNIQEINGDFEIMENTETVATGRIRVADKNMESDAFVPMLANAANIKANDNGDHLLLKQKDIYKEMKLRGYQYRGLFKALEEFDGSTNRFMVRWHNNEIAFMDNMLQINILGIDSRELFVPTRIERVHYDGKRHRGFVQKFVEEETPLLPGYVFPDINVIRCGGIELKGMTANAITRRKPLGEPVLEKHVFVPNETSLSLEESVRVNLQIILENERQFQVKTVEVLDEETKEHMEPLSPAIGDVLGDQPLIKPDIVVLTNKSVEIRNAKVEEKKLAAENDGLLVVAAKVLSRTQTLQQCLKLVNNGYILSREDPAFAPSAFSHPLLDLLTVHRLPSETLLLLRKKRPLQTPVKVKIGGDDEFEWLPLVKKVVGHGAPLLLYAEGEEAGCTGVMGLVNCIRREPNVDNLSLVVVMDGGVAFDASDEVFRGQLEKNLAVNVYKDGKWGTYRHLLLQEPTFVEMEHACGEIPIKGDLSNMKFYQGPLKFDSRETAEKKIYHVYYAALNFRDVMAATGRISQDVFTKDRITQNSGLGFEFVGRDEKGKRVVGMCSAGLSNIILSCKYFCTEIPDEWSMEDAATVLITYCTVLYALKYRVNIRRGQTILIHAGSGGVGQAAIHVCLYHGLTVFTTVGTPEKREFLKKHFPQLKDDHIGNSRDASFEQLVKRRTRGRGVDYVLNSLAEEKLQASVRCLRRGGDFLEIGKYDLAKDNPLDTELFARGATFHGVMLDAYFDGAPKDKQMIIQLLRDGYKGGYVKPLVRRVFGTDELEDALRYMAGGKHIGKILIKVRDEEQDRKALPRPILMKGLPKMNCTDNHSYVIAGGLGGFGLELADWLVLRGAKLLVLNSRNGVKNGYQAYRISTWRSYGTKVVVSTADITTKEGCQQLINEANELGPVAGIFNLAVVLQDAILENQTEEKFKISFGPKALATKYLDEITRRDCPELRHFVVFSSVSCGRGNAGQTNYGMANSVMERICEKRKKDGLPGLAIQWGAIGEVGLVAELQEQDVEMAIGGTLQQKISSCFKVMDQFLTQDEPIVSSMVVAEKRDYGAGNNIVECVANILGVKDMKKVSFHRSLAEMGMDSMMAVEIKQTLEREYDVFLTAQDIRSLTFNRLEELQKERETKGSDQLTKQYEGFELLIGNFGKEEAYFERTVKIASVFDKLSPVNNSKIFIVPGIEGTAALLQPLAEKLKGQVTCLQFAGPQCGTTIEEMAKYIYESLRPSVHPEEDFTLVAYSAGCLVTLELLSMLERDGIVPRAVFIDGAPELMFAMVEEHNVDPTGKELEVKLVLAVLAHFTTEDVVLKHKDEIIAAKNFQEMVDILVSTSASFGYSADYRRMLATDYHRKIQAVLAYKCAIAGLKTTLTLVRPKQQAVAEFKQDYGLSQYTARPVDVVFLEGNHSTVLGNPGLVEVIHARANADVVAVENVFNDSVRMVQPNVEEKAV